MDKEQITHQVGSHLLRMVDPVHYKDFLYRFLRDDVDGHTISDVAKAYADRYPSKVMRVNEDGSMPE